MHYGLLGEYDPILRRRFFRYNDSNECYFPTKFFRLISDNRTSPGVSSLPPFVNNALFAYKKTSVAIRENYKFLTPGLDLDDYLSRANLLYPHIPSIVILYVKHILASLPIIDGSTINEFLADPSGKISRARLNSSIHFGCFSCTRLFIHMLHTIRQFHSLAWTS